MPHRPPSRLRVSPTRYDKTGYVSCTKAQADCFDVSYFGSEPRYGEGWFPAYDTDMKHRYKDLNTAIAKAEEFQRRWNIETLEIEG